MAKSAEDRITDEFIEHAASGHIVELESLLARVPLSSKPFCFNTAFTIAARNGQLAVLERLLELIPDASKREAMIHGDNDFAFQAAARLGHLAMMERLLELTPDEEKREAMIHANNDFAFQAAVQLGHLAMMERLLELTPDASRREAMIHTNNNYGVKRAAANGHLAVMERLLELTPNMKKRVAMISIVFILAAAKSRLPVMERLLELTPDALRREAMKHLAFGVAAEHGQLAVMEYLLKLTPDAEQRDAMIHARNDHAFGCAAHNAQLAVLERLLELIPDASRRKSMKLLAFRVAAENGQLAVLEFLLELIPDASKREAMINIAFILAAAKSHLPVMERLLELTPNMKKREAMIHAHNDHAFRFAAHNGHFAVLERLLELTPDAEQREVMIHVDNDYAFKVAAQYGHFAVLERLLSLIPDAEQREIMIHVDNDYAFRFAAENGQLAVLDLLLELTPNASRREAMIHAHNDQAFKLAKRAGKLDILTKAITAFEAKLKTRVALEESIRIPPPPPLDFDIDDVEQLDTPEGSRKSVATTDTSVQPKRKPPTPGLKPVSRGSRPIPKPKPRVRPKPPVPKPRVEQRIIEERKIKRELEALKSQVRAIQEQNNHTEEIVVESSEIANDWIERTAEFLQVEDARNTRIEELQVQYAGIAETLKSVLEDVNAKNKELTEQKAAILSHDLLLAEYEDERRARRRHDGAERAMMSVVKTDPLVRTLYTTVKVHLVPILYAEFALGQFLQAADSSEQKLYKRGKKAAKAIPFASVFRAFSNVFGGSVVSTGADTYIQRRLEKRATGKIESLASQWALVSSVNKDEIAENVAKRLVQHFAKTLTFCTKDADQIKEISDQMVESCKDLLCDGKLDEIRGLEAQLLDVAISKGEELFAGEFISAVPSLVPPPSTRTIVIEHREQQRAVAGAFTQQQIIELQRKNAELLERNAKIEATQQLMLERLAAFEGSGKS